MSNEGGSSLSKVTSLKGVRSCFGNNAFGWKESLDFEGFFFFLDEGRCRGEIHDLRGCRKDCSCILKILNWEGIG